MDTSLLPPSVCTGCKIGPSALQHKRDRARAILPFCVSNVLFACFHTTALALEYTFSSWDSPEEQTAPRCLYVTMLNAYFSLVLFVVFVAVSAASILVPPSKSPFFDHNLRVWPDHGHTRFAGVLQLAPPLNFLLTLAVSFSVTVSLVYWCVIAAFSFPSKPVPIFLACSWHLFNTLFVVTDSLLCLMPLRSYPVLMPVRRSEGLLLVRTAWIPGWVGGGFWPLPWLYLWALIVLVTRCYPYLFFNPSFYRDERSGALAIALCMILGSIIVFVKGSVFQLIMEIVARKQGREPLIWPDLGPVSRAILHSRRVAMQGLFTGEMAK